MHVFVRTKCSRFQKNILILEKPLVKGRLLTVIPRLSTEWIVSFTIRMTTLSFSDFCNIIHLTQNDNTGTYGDRTPAVFLYRKPYTEQTLFRSAVNGKNNHNHSSRIPKINELTHFEIHQRYVSGGKYRYFIKMNGQEIHSTVNDKAQQFYNVKVYASNPWGNACPGYIKNFAVTNFL